MAKFVLAGKADCPHYAKAELLADALQRCLPNFRIHKIPVLPDDWKEWLEAICKTNCWKHEASPLVWRELVDQGGKGLLLGGVGDFLRHCQDYYDFTSDMTRDTMASIAAENLEAKMALVEEEKLRLSLVKPLQVWISSALGATCHSLIPGLLSAEVFPGVAAIALHLLGPEGREEALRGLKMEIQDLALPLLHQVSVHTGPEEAFRGADVILLLDESWRDDGELEEEKEKEEKEEEERVKISKVYTEYGRLIDAGAHRQVKVMVAGDSFLNLRCSLLVDNAPSVDSRQFVAVATQLENEARAAMAKKLSVAASDVTDVTVWGNISGSFYVDLQRAKVFNFDGPVKGPGFFSQSVLEIFHDREWMETDFQDAVRRRRAAVASKTGRASAAASAAHGILTVLRAWNATRGPDRVFSLGVTCPGLYNLPDGIVLSVPVTFADGSWSPLSVAVGDELMERLRVSASELLQERELGSEGS